MPIQPESNLAAPSFGTKAPVRSYEVCENTDGDTIRTESGSRAATWVIVSRRVVDKAAPALFPSKKATLTLTTCWPIRYLGSAPDRLVLTAKPVAGPPVIPGGGVIANAVFAACGARVTELPLTPERVRRAMELNNHHAV